MPMNITGVYPPIATPFDAQGELDERALESNVARWNETGLSGYVVAGSNGESALLEDDEVVRAVRIVRGAAAAGKLVIAGVGRESTRATCLLSVRAAEAGADAVLVMNPSFYSGQMTPDALVCHYTAVADASPVPVVVYNVPKFTNLNMAAATVARMAEHPNIIGIKDSAGDIGQVIDLLRLCPQGFAVLVGNAPAFLSGLQVGAAGGVLALANVAPRECVAIWQLAAQGRWDEARAIHFRLMPVGRAVTSGYGVPGLKAALDLLGYAGGDPRPPLVPLASGDRAALRKTLERAGLL